MTRSHRPLAFASGSVALAVVAIAVTSCMNVRMEAPGPDAVVPALVELRYHRTAPPSTVRPETLNVITNETGPGSHRQYTGIWDQTTQTLSVMVIVPYDVESVVYVNDPALPSGSTTTITATRANLRDAACPQGITSSSPCQGLMVPRSR